MRSEMCDPSTTHLVFAAAARGYLLICPDHVQRHGHPNAGDQQALAAAQAIGCENEEAHGRQHLHDTVHAGSEERNVRF